MGHPTKFWPAMELNTISATSAFQFCLTVQLQHLLRRRWVQHVELRRIRKARSSYASACVRSVVVGVPQFDFMAQQEPVCAWRPKWHADATGIHDTCLADHAVKLHVSVAANHDIRICSVEYR